MKSTKTIYLLAISIILTSAGCADKKNKNITFSSQFEKNTTRCWLGPQYWANPLQDWQLNNGRIEVLQSGGNRNIYLLTHELRKKDGRLEMSVDIGQLDMNTKLDDGWVGFKIGIRGEFNEYRDSAIWGEGLNLGMYTGGRVFIGKYDPSVKKVKGPYKHVTLKLTAKPKGKKYSLYLKALDDNNQILSEVRRDDIDPDWLIGGVALVCSWGKISKEYDTRPPIERGVWGSKEGTNRGGNVKFWFENWKISGSKLVKYPQRAFGPILFSQYTLSDNIMTMTAQMPPIGDSDSQTVILETRQSGQWKKIQKAQIEHYSRTATFRVYDWQSIKDVPYRLVYELADAEGNMQKHYWQGTVRKDPVDKKELVVAGFTGNNDLGFPNKDLVRSVSYHNPDFLFFSGDQIYEGVAGFGIQTDPLELACIDYLRKWYLYGWAYRELLKDRPAVSIPDDHDVYHGNIWGAGGKATDPVNNYTAAQDSGGYRYSPTWVNMVQQTQTGNLPLPFDPTPVLQNIGVYYCNINYGGVSFAVIEDRKFKSAPKALLPEAKIVNGFQKNPDFDSAARSDVPGAVLLGQRQLDFLEDWAKDWPEKIWCKSLLSQTIFANVATLPEIKGSGQAVPGLKIFKPGEYPPNDKPVSDYDSNAWPKTPRDNAVKTIRKAFAFHLAGDQHLGSTIQYGVDDWGDSGFAFCVPAVSNVWPRRWFPKDGGKNQIPGKPKYTGDYVDGFNNKITVHAISNPVYTGLKPAKLYDRATGFGLVRFNKDTRKITVECWPRQAEPSSKNFKQYPDWPVVIDQMDNYKINATGYLPKIVSSKNDPVVQVIDESNNEVLYTVRIKGDNYIPPVNSDGPFTIKVGKSSTDMIEMNQVEPYKDEQASNLNSIEF